MFLANYRVTSIRAHRCDASADGRGPGPQPAGTIPAQSLAAKQHGRRDSSSAEFVLDNAANETIVQSVIRISGLWRPAKPPGGAAERAPPARPLKNKGEMT